MTVAKYFTYFSFILLFFSSTINAQGIKVDFDKTNEQLVKEVFLGNVASSCIEVSNVTFSGFDFNTPDKSYGYFTKNGSNFEMESGIILSSGNAAKAKGPNTSLLSDGPRTWDGDRDLEDALNIRDSYNATILEFDFIAHNSTRINFDYLFASEQYLRSGDRGSCNYTDGFTFLIKEVGSTQPYQNLAVIPNTNIPIRSNTVRGGGQTCEAVNAQYFGHYNFDNSATNYNGQTQILTATTEIIPGKKYHLKLVIADQGNELYDSAVFLKAGSFVGNKSIGSDKLISNNTALCPGATYLLDATTPGATYQWYKDGISISGAMQATHLINSPGIYTVDINTSNCPLKGTIKVEYLSDIEVKEQTFTYCDDKINNQVAINLDYLSTFYLPNDPKDYKLGFYPTQIDALANSNEIVNDFVISADKTIFVKVQYLNCPPVTQPLHLIVQPKINLNSPSAIDFCDNELKGKVDINLKDYISLFNNTPNLQVDYYNNEGDAKNSRNPISNTMIELSTSRTFYYRIKSQNYCANVASITFNYKQPKQSTTLQYKIICPSETTVLNAGTGFDYYEWSNGTKGTHASSITVGPGDYWVDLHSNGCIFRQYVSITSPEPFTIDAIHVNGGTATVEVQGNLANYQFSLDNKNWQSSPIFTNIPRGLQTMYVKQLNACDIVSKEFLIINLLNVITPNGDGFNDTLNYSDLKIKKDVSLQIIDRYGKPIYQSQGLNYNWDGKVNGRPVATGTYWYILRWIEPDTENEIYHKNWILIKNRD